MLGHMYFGTNLKVLPASGFGHGGEHAIALLGLHRIRVNRAVDALDTALKKSKDV